jgi:hypothetical protein
MTMEPRVPGPSHWDAWYGTLMLAFGGVQESPKGRALDHDLAESERSIGVQATRPDGARGACRP